MLSRDNFRESVFKRDSHKCVICGEPAKDAHHIIERRLFPDGGYYLDNGVSLCEKHHIEAETTVLSCESIRSAANITKIILPPQLYPDERYDKWGNPFLANGLRIRGELFDDVSVQRILPDDVKSQFTKFVKYPRTWHLPWSPGAGKGDRILESVDFFEGQEVVVTEKMDGENTTLYCDYSHARSVSSSSDATRHWVKNFHAGFAGDIPDGWRLCGENLFAKHSIFYDNLCSYFMLFSVWDDRNICLSWDETVIWADLLGIKMVPVLYRGVFDEKLIKELYRSGTEGYVVRLACSFKYLDFVRSVGKFVRAEHIQTNQHWLRTWTPNKLKSN